MFRITENSECLSEQTAVTIGKFDGIHLGHRSLLEAVLKEKKNGYAACVLSLVKSDGGRNVIYTKEEQSLLCDALGIDILAEYSFDETLRELSAEQFISEVLCRKFNAKVIVAGEDFRFGKGRAGDVKLLNALEKTYGYRTVCVPKVEKTGMRISSTGIRELLSLGKIEEANRLLGQPYFLCGEVVHGKQLGRTIGFPTINVLPPEEKLLPAYGVYATQTKLDGVWYRGITNVGLRPTVNSGSAVSVETYLLHCSGNLYGKRAEIRFLQFLRPEQRFQSVEELTEAIRRDAEKAEKL